MPTPPITTSAVGPAAPPALVPAQAPDYIPGRVQRERAEPEPARRAALAVLAARLTPRDRWLLRMLFEHPVLTSTQISALAFGRLRTANRRLRVLAEDLKVLDRFRPRVESGSAPEHYLLAPAGAMFLAAERETTIKALGYHRSRALAIAVSPRLAHAVGAAGVFTALAASARTAPQTGRLTAWWAERTCLALWGDLARPDGYGRWHAGHGAAARSLDFFLEYDTGTETLERLLGKLPGYARLARSTGITSPVLFYLHSASREAALHRALALEAPEVPVATTTPYAIGVAGTGPGGPVWRVGAGNLRARLALIDLYAYAVPAAVPARGPQATATAALAATGWVPPPPPLPPAPAYQDPASGQEA